MEKQFEKDRTFTLNQHEPDQYGNTYTGTVWINKKPYWLNAKDANGPNGPFISGYIGKEKQPKGGTPQSAPRPAPAKPTPSRTFEVDFEDTPF